MIFKTVSFYTIFRTFVLAPDNERMIAAMKKEYITEINNLLPHADAELLDLILQLLKKSVAISISPSETHLQPA